MGAHAGWHEVSVTQPQRGPSGVLLQKQPPESHIGKHTSGPAVGQAVPTPEKASQRSTAGGSASAGPASGDAVSSAAASLDGGRAQQRRRRGSRG